MGFAITPDIQIEVLDDFGQAVSIGPDWHEGVARLLEGRRPENDPIAIDAERLREWAAGVGSVPEWAWDAIASLSGQRAGMLKQCSDKLSRIKRGLDQR